MLCCVLYLDYWTSSTAARWYFNPLIHYAQHVFAWVPDGKNQKTTRIRPSGFLLRQNSPNAMKKMKIYRAASFSGEREQYIQPIQGLCAHIAAARLKFYI
jgi:hypothetical protein